MLVSLQKRRVNGKRAVHTEYSSLRARIERDNYRFAKFFAAFSSAIDREYFRTHGQTLLTMLTQSITKKLQDFDSKQ